MAGKGKGEGGKGYRAIGLACTCRSSLYMQKLFSLKIKAGRMFQALFNMHLMCELYVMQIRALIKLWSCFKRDFTVIF